MRVELGMRARDKITGLTGIVIAEAQYLTGSRQVGLLPPLPADGKYPDTNWFDEHRIEIVEEQRIMEPVALRAIEPSGGPMNDAAPPRG